VGTEQPGSVSVIVCVFQKVVLEWGDGYVSSRTQRHKRLILDYLYIQRARVSLLLSLLLLLLLLPSIDFSWSP